MWAIRAIFILLIAALTAAPPAMAEDRDGKISDAYGWFTRFSDLTDADLKVQITEDSVTIFEEGPSNWIKRRGRFEKLAKNLFVLLPDEMVDSSGANLLSKAPCPIYKIELWRHGYVRGNRPRISITSYPSMEGLREGRFCFGISYDPIDPPFDRPAN